MAPVQVEVLEGTLGSIRGIVVYEPENPTIADLFQLVEGLEDQTSKAGTLVNSFQSHSGHS